MSKKSEFILSDCSCSDKNDEESEGESGSLNNFIVNDDQIDEVLREEGMTNLDLLCSPSDGKCDIYFLYIITNIICM